MPVDQREAVLAERRRLGRLHVFERKARSAGFRFIGGVDEVGRGPLAGPVIAACVLTDGPLMLTGLNDSKAVPVKRRAELDAEIRERSVAVGVGAACVEEIDRINIYWASLLAMERAIIALPVKPDFLLTDAVRIANVAIPQEPVIKGDAKCATVAAASIVAKVFRDRLMLELDTEFPQYGFRSHKGYATAQHLAALRAHGPCAHHRRFFAPVQDALTLFELPAP